MTIREFAGVSVLPPAETVQYLGYEIGTGDLQHRNWAVRMRKLQRRLFTATKVATSVENRVRILNAIILPSILFTAAVFDIPEWAGRAIQNLYKQFLWAHATSTEASRHKINPGLLFTPKPAGGVGLASVGVAIKRTKHALQWLTQREDKYFSAWRSWTYQGGPTYSSLLGSAKPRQIARFLGFTQQSKESQHRDLEQLLQPTAEHHIMIHAPTTTY